jgi:uncharacterized protein
MNRPHKLSPPTLIGLFVVFNVWSLEVRAQTGTSPSPTAASETYPSVPTRYFNDYAGVTTEGTQDSLNARLAEFDRRTTNQVVVSIFKRKTSNIPLAEYCTQVASKWGVGQRGKNNGVVLFVFMEDHLLRISTGRGMEAVLPDEKCEKIIDQVITPEFRKHEFDEGLTAGVDAILKAIAAKQPVAPGANP